MAYWMFDEVTQAIRDAWERDVLKTKEDTVTDNERAELRNFILRKTNRN